MAVVTFELRDLKELGISKENVGYVVDRLGMSLEGTTETEISIDITPNRPDMLHITGFAKAAEYLLGKKLPKERFYAINNNPVLEVKVTGAVKKIQPFIAVAVVKNVNLKGSKLKNLVDFTEKFCDTYGRKRKKLSMGIYNFDEVGGPLSYDALSDAEFVPLGSTKKASIDKILKEHQKGIEYSSILGKTKRYPVLKDSKNILALIPIINSENTKVTTETKNLLIDITANSRNAAESAMNLMACIFIDMGANVYPCKIFYKKNTVITPNMEYRDISVKKSNAENTLGFRLDENKMINLVNKLGYPGTKHGKDTVVHVPPYRLDVLNDQDVIEDIAIAYGYDNIPTTPIIGSAAGKPDKLKDYSNKLCTLMIGLGFSEAINFYLTNENLNFERFGYKHDQSSIIKVAYAKTETITMLRTHLLPGLMDNLSSSVQEKMPQKLFEIGSVFYLHNGKVVESTNIAMVSEHSKVNYSEMKAAVLEFLKFIGVKNYSFRELNNDAFISGRAAEIISNKQSLGYFGEISPKVLSNFKLEEPVCAAELLVPESKGIL